MPFLLRDVFRVLMSAEPGAGGAAAEPEVFSREYVRELREEAKGHRLKVQELEAQLLAAAQEQALVLGRDALWQERLVQAVLRGEALRAGLLDLDALRLADVSSLSVAEDGAVLGAEAVLAALKAGKPYLFAGGAFSASTVAAPVARLPEVKSATAMSAAEYRAEKARLLGR